jgi:vacuolar-type H+-ATPase subunit H
MLPDLAKIIIADRKARAIVDQAQKEAQALLDQAQTQVQAIQAELQAKLNQIRETVQKEILYKAEERASEVADSTERYITGLREKQGTHGDEVAAFLLSQVLAE